MAAPRRRLGLWIGAAALIHLEIMAILGVLLYVFAPRDADLKKRLEALGPGESIDIGMVDADAAREIIADLERAAREARKEEIKKEIEKPRAPGQVVEIPRPQEERRPDDARFAAEYDSTVPRQTKRYGKFRKRSQAGEADARATEARPALSGSSAPPGPPSPPSPSKLAMRTPTPGEAVNRTREAAPDPEGLLAPSGGAERPVGPQTGAPATSPGFPSLRPSERQIAKAIGGGTQDALENVDEGETTALNAKKWKFATFFNRVKRQVSDHWRPDDAYQRRDPTGAIYGRKDRLTILRVRLKPDGSLAGVDVEQPSGIDFLDDVAVEAFRDAQPFPNPPRQLVEDNGLINFRFGFLLELSSAPRFRMFRYRQP